jgi:hypothetical protein
LQLRTNTELFALSPHFLHPYVIERPDQKANYLELTLRMYRVSLIAGIYGPAALRHNFWNFLD